MQENDVCPNTPVELDLNYSLNENEDVSFQWSTGETTEDIVVEIEETTEFWVDVTVNSLTCRETITINIKCTSCSYWKFYWRSMC